MNSRYSYGVFHPEHLVDLLRAGGRFPTWQTFAFPSYSDATEINDFIDRKFPALSEERYEVWLRFQFDGNFSKTIFSLNDIVSAHFFSDHRRNATSAGVLQTLAVYGIDIGEPLEDRINSFIEAYTKNLRQHVASAIVKAWFPKVEISHKFLEQLIIGYEYQQSPAPEKLPAIPSKMIWAHLVAYNPGLRKFEERPRVLLLQDIQEVLRRTDADFKNDLKSIGDKYSSKFSDLVDQAERFQGELSKWLLQNRSTPYTYLLDLEQYLNKSADQQSFFYTSLLYLYWRTEVLNKDYIGKLSDKKDVQFFLANASNIGMEQAVAEALFTIIYAGGPRIFQKALIEARGRILNLSEPKASEVKRGKPIEVGKQLPVKSLIPRLFQNLKKELGKLFDRRYTGNTDEKKKELLENIRLICGTKGSMSKGEFDYFQYVKLCRLFGVEVEIFDDVTNIEIERSSVVPPAEIQNAITICEENPALSTEQAGEPDSMVKGINPEVILAEGEGRDALNRLVSPSNRSGSDNKLESQIEKNESSVIASSEGASFIISDDEGHEKVPFVTTTIDMAVPDIENAHPEAKKHVDTSETEIISEKDGGSNEVDKEPVVTLNPKVDVEEKGDQKRQVMTTAKRGRKPKEKNVRENVPIKPELDFFTEGMAEVEKEANDNN